MDSDQAMTGAHEEEQRELPVDDDHECDYEDVSDAEYIAVRCRICGNAISEKRRD